MYGFLKQKLYWLHNVQIQEIDASPLNAKVRGNLFSHEPHTCQSNYGLMEIPNHGYFVKFPQKQLLWDYNNKFPIKMLQTQIAVKWVDMFSQS